MNIKKLRFTRTLLVAALVLLSVLGSSCLGVLQEISANPNGKIETFVRFTLSKATVEAIGEMGGEAEDTDDIFDLDDGPVNPETIPGLTNVVVEKVDNAVDVGMSFHGTLSRLPAGTQPEDAPFIPFDIGDSVVIALPPIDEGDDEPADPQGEQFAAMFFASTKYQLSLDKNLYPEIYSAQVETSSGVKPATVTELTASWLVEFPFLTWMQAADGCRIVVRR